MPRTVGLKGEGPRRIALPHDASLLHPLKLGLSSGVLLRVQAARRAGVEMGGTFVSRGVVANIMLDKARLETEANNFGKFRQNLLVLDRHLREQC